MQQEHSESAPEQRIVPYKSNQRQHNIKLCAGGGRGSAQCVYVTLLWKAGSHNKTK